MNERRLVLVVVLVAFVLMLASPTPMGGMEPSFDSEVGELLKQHGLSADTVSQMETAEHIMVDTTGIIPLVNTYTKSRTLFFWQILVIGGNDGAEMCFPKLIWDAGMSDIDVTIDTTNLYTRPTVRVHVVEFDSSIGVTVAYYGESGTIDAPADVTITSVTTTDAFVLNNGFLTTSTSGYTYSWAGCYLKDSTTVAVFNGGLSDTWYDFTFQVVSCSHSGFAVQHGSKALSGGASEYLTEDIGSAVTIAESMITMQAGQTASSTDCYDYYSNHAWETYFVDTDTIAFERYDDAPIQARYFNIYYQVIEWGGLATVEHLDETGMGEGGDGSKTTTITEVDTSATVVLLQGTAWTHWGMAGEIYANSDGHEYALLTSTLTDSTTVTVKRGHTGTGYNPPDYRIIVIEFTTNVAPVNDPAPICTNLDDTDNLYARYKLYEFNVSVTDDNGATDINWINLASFKDEVGYWGVTYTESTNAFSTSGGAGYVQESGSTYNKGSYTIDLTIKVYIKWAHPDVSDVDLRVWSRDDSSEDDVDINYVDYDYETRLDFSSFSLSDASGTADRGDINSIDTITASGTVIYYGSGNNYPASDKVDVWVSCADIAGSPWSDLTLSSGAFAMTVDSDDVVGLDTYTFKAVQEGAGSSGTDENHATHTDTYIADQTEITWFNSSDYRDDIGTTLELRVKARLAYDDESLGSGDSITLNTSLSMTWDAVNGWFDYNPMAYSYVVAHVYNVTAASETAHGVTEFVWHSGVDSHVDGNYLDTNEYTAFQLQTFTLTFWWMSESYRDGVDAANGENFVIWRNYNGGTTGGFLLPYRNWGDNDGLMRWYAIYNNTASGQSATYKHTYHNAYQWYFGTYAVNSTGYCWVYVDGVLQYEWQAASFQEWCYIANRDVTILGDWGDDWPASGDEFRFYNRVLDADEVLATMYGHYDDTGLVAYYPFDGDFNDYSGNGYDCAVVGSVDPTGPSYPQKLVWDGLMVDMWVSDGRDNVGDAITIYANFTYAWDGTLADVSAVVIETVGATESASNLWYISQTRNYVVSKQYAVDSFTDDNYGLTQILWWHVDTSTSEYVNIPDHADLKPAILTVATWIRLTDASALRHLWCTKWNGWSSELTTDHRPFFRVTNGGDSPYGDALVIGDWYHFVGVYNPNGDAEFQGNSLFINGVRVGTTYQTGAITHSTYGLDIGKYRGGLPFGGNVRDVRIYNRALTSTEILLLYYGQEPSSSGLVLHLTPNSWNIEDDTWHDMSGLGHDGTIYGDEHEASTIDPVFVNPVWDALAFDIYIDNDRYDLSGSVTITCNAVYAYDGTTFTDADGSTLTFDTFGAASYSGGLWTDSAPNSYIVQGNYYVSAFTDGIYGLTKITSGFYFAGTDDRLEIPHDSSQTAISDFTIEGWFYPTSSAESKVIVAKAYGASRQFMVWWLSTSQISFVYKNTTYFNIGCSPTGLALNTWHHFVITIDGTFNLNSWYDGIHYLTDYTMAESLIQRDVPILIGVQEYSANVFTYDFIGYISHLRMYSRALTDDECYAHYQRHYESDTNLVFALTGSGLRGNAGTYGQWIDSTANNNDATAYSGAAMFQNSGGDKRIRPIWETVSWELWVDAGRVNAGVDTVRVWFDAVYAYDGSAFEGSVTIEGNAMTPSGGAWYYDISAQSVGRYTWDTIDITDTRFGLNDQQAGIYFDGSNDYATIVDSAALNTNQDYSVSVWFYYSGDGTAGKVYWTIAAKNNVGSGYLDSWHFYVAQTTHYLKCRVGGGSSSLEYSLSSGVDVYDSNWHMATLTYDHSERQFKLFLDGYLKETYDAAWDCVDNADVIRLGSWNGYGDYYKGYISEILHWSRTLPDSEVFLLYAGQYNTTNLEMRIDGLSFQYKETYELADRIASHDLNFVGPLIYDLTSVETTLPVWDRLAVDIQADDETPDTGVTVTFTITVTYEFDSVTCITWTVNIQRNATADWVSRSYPTTTFTDSHATPLLYQYLANAASETAYGITVFSTNTETVEWHNQIPYNVSLSVDYDDSDNWYARYRYYLITFTVGDNDGYANIEAVQIALFESTRTTMSWSVNYTQATDTFTEAYGGSKIVLAGWTYDDSSGNQIILYIYIKVEWSHGELTDADFRGYVIDDEAESDLDWYDENAEIVCTLDYTVTPTVTDAVADGTRGDISGSITGAGTVIYYGSGNNYPLANETDVWILHDVSGTWSDEVDGSGAFSKAMTADSSVRESTYTIKVVIQGAGSGGTDLYYTTTVTDTYISDSLTITITDPTDPEQRIDLNVNATGIVVSAVYDYDSATYDGTFTLNSTTFSYATVGKRGYTVSSASGDDSFGITAISTNDETYCIWDEMIVLYILADDDVSYLGLSVNFTVGLQYKYDSDNVQTGTFSLEALALAFSAGANWTVSDSHGTSGTWLYNDVTGTDGAYTLTGIDMDSNSISVVWDTIVISASLNYDWTLIGYNLTITTTGTFEHLGYTWNGTPTWSGTDYPEESTIGNYTYTLNSITDPDYGVTTFTNDPTLWAIFDTVNCSRSALYWKNTLDADWLYLDTAAFFFGFNESGLTENFKIQSYYGYPDASTSSDYAYVNNHSQIDRLIIGNFSGAGMDTINASYSAVCTVLGEPEYRIWSYDMSYLDVRNVVYEDTVFVDAGARAYILNNEEVRNEIHIVLYNNSMIAGSYAKDGTSIWVRVLAYREDTFPTKEQIWSGTKSLSTNTGGTVVWSLRNWDAWNICNKWNTATSPFIYIHYSTVSSGGPWTFINAFHALGSNYNLDPYSDATWTVDLERSQVLVESDWSPDRENLTAWMEADGLTPYGYGEFSQYEWINAENWNRYVWEALVTIWADFGAPITGPAPLGMPQYVLNREPIGTQPLGVITAPLTGWQIASGVDDISYFWLDVFPQWAFWYEEDGQWYQTADYDISLWLRTRLENNILWSPWYQKLADPNNYETGQHFQENLVQPFDYRDTELSIAGERVALSGDITFSFDYIIYENDVNVGTGSVNITPTLNVWSQFAIYWDRQQGTGNVNYSIYCNTTAYEEWSSQSLWINGTYSKAEPPSGFTIEQFEVEYDDVYINIYCETNWANSTLYLYVDGSLKATSAEADIIQYRKSMTEGTHTLDILIDAGSQTRWRNYTYAIGVDAITLKIIEFEWDTGSSNTYSCFVRTNWGNATVRLLEDGNTRFIQTEIGKGMSFRLSKVQRIGVHTVTLQIDAGGQILTYVLGYSYREPDHPSDTPDVGPVLSVIGDELSDSIEGKVVLHPALVGFFLSTAFMAVIILIIVFKWLLKEPIL